MKRDVDNLQALYEQILISEDTEISKYGYPKEFIKELYSSFNIPHDAKFIKLTKMPYTSELEDEYHLVIAKVKNPDECEGCVKMVAVMDTHIYEFDGTHFNEYFRTQLDFSTIRSAVDKSTIYGALKRSQGTPRNTSVWGRSRSIVRREKLTPIYYGIFDLLQSKFGSMFHKKIESLSEYIYSNIRKIKFTQSNIDVSRLPVSGIYNSTDIETVIKILKHLNTIKNQSKESLFNNAYSNSSYKLFCDDVIKEFLVKYDPDMSTNIEEFVTQFNKHPSYSMLGRMFLKAFDVFEDVVYSYVNGAIVDELF